ncbi:MAG: hypothetical protein GY856_43615 [bacterium]|nr:hypothetical protein [bacterium]
MAKRLALVLLAISSPGMLVTFVWRTAAGEVLFSLLAVIFPLALIALGAQKRGRLGPLLAPLAVVTLHLLAGVVAMLALRGRVLDGPWLWGLPLAAAILVYGIFLLPLLLVSLSYALSFERYGLRAEDLEQLRRRFRRGDPEEE